MRDKGAESLSGMAIAGAAGVAKLERRLQALEARPVIEYEFFLLPAAPYLAEPLRPALRDWFNQLGENGWTVFSITPQKDNPAGYIAWAWRVKRQ